MDIIKRAFLELSNAEDWFSGKITEQEAKKGGVNPEMVEHWYGKLYERQERLIKQCEAQYAS